MSKLYYYAKRALISVVLIWAIATFLFFAFKALPGSYADQLLRSGMAAEKVAQVKARWGLDDPIYVQYGKWLFRMITGDAGTSRVYGEPVWSVVKTALMNSFILVLPGLLTAFVLGTLYGALMGNNQGSLLERYGIIPPTVIGTSPDFFVSIVMIVVFSAWFGLFPAGSIASIQTMTANDTMIDVYMTTDFWWHYTLPFLTITLKYMYYPALIMRGSVVEVRGQEFAKYQRLLGLSSLRRFRHVLKHASLPVITLLPTVTARALGGLVLIEMVFNWPGIGKLLLNSVFARDIPVIQFVFLLIAIWIVVGNFLVDIFYTVVDPRITIEGDQ